MYVLLIVAAHIAQVACPAFAQAPRFGDSTWVAPYPQAATEAEPAGTGPRVAEPDRARPLETAIRLPFRVAFYPLRLVARGAEHLVGFVGPRYDPSRHYRVLPTFVFSSAAGPAIGVRVAPPKIAFSRHDYVAKLKATWSTRDTRRVKLEQWIGQQDRPLCLGIDYTYNYRPNYRFYGLGNDSDVRRRSTYLEEESQIEARVRYGVDSFRRLTFLGGYSDMSVRRGYNGSASKVQDEFSPEEVPFVDRGSEIYYYGVAGDFALLDDFDNPSFGLHGRGLISQNHGASGLDLKYLSWRAEARGYIPVFANRRVIAMRVVHEAVDPTEESEDVPFYRLPIPSASHETRFSAYRSRRFRDKHLLLAHVEYRWVIWEKLWALALAQVGQVAPEAGALRISDVHESYGGGLRLSLKDHATARAEIAKGAEGTAFHVDVSSEF